MAAPLGAALLSAGARFGMRALPHVSGYGRAFATGQLRAKASVKFSGVQVNASYGSGRGAHFSAAVTDKRAFISGVGRVAGVNVYTGKRRQSSGAARRNRGRRQRG